MKIFDKIKGFFKKIDESDKKAIGKLLTTLTIGAMLNFALFCIFRLPFTWYSWIGYAFLIHIVENKLIVWIRQVLFSK
jgi:hypothetical protein